MVGLPHQRRLLLRDARRRAARLAGWLLVLSLLQLPGVRSARAAAAEVASVTKRVAPGESTAALAEAATSAVATLARTKAATDVMVSRSIGQCFEREDPACASPWIAELARRAPGSFTLRYAKAHADFLSGHYGRASQMLARIAKSPAAPKAIVPAAKRIAAAAEASRIATAGFARRLVAGGRFEIWHAPGADKILVPLLDEVLSKAAATLSVRLGPLPTAPIVVHIYPRVEQLAAVSGLTTTQIRTSGTIALCKHNRLMITSPRDLVFGYAWADTVSHELVHYLITKHGGAGVPVWLHEAIARTLETSWRDTSAPDLDATERSLLWLARKRRRFIRLARMHPTMAALPSQQAAQLAFAEVHHALLWLHHRAKSHTPTARIGKLIARLGAGESAFEAVRSWSGEARFPTSWWASLRRGEDATGDKIKPSKSAQRRAILRFRRVARRRAGGSAAARFVELGDRLLAINRPLAAVLEYRKAQSKGATDDVMMLTRLARGLLALHRHVEAKVVIDDALSRYGEHAPLLVLSAKAAAGLGDHDGTLHWTRQALWLNPFDPALHNLRAAAFTAKGQPALAAAATVDAASVAH
ncbi:MAG: hypothetical protein KC502_14590 [Myxococcales bacterium]|nr:hypothetical protein [Myxococcales bacterium]